ncbi:MAG TPA: citrate/2-methylcitrate synthase, partial [Chloroflexota bacterium]|nr:citrate/2-methylcitrate synthase [Chloroflexota bacterium]
DPELSHAANYLYMLSGRLPDPTACQALSVLLNLYAEHELSTSTFTARMVITTRSDFYSAMVAAISALKGPLHGGGAIDDVMRTLMTIGSVDRVPEHVEQELAITGRLPGFGRRLLYPADDPRAMHVKHVLGELARGHSQWALLTDALARCVEQKTGELPTIDFYAAPALYHLGFPLELFTNVVASARVAGWAAHVLEQYGDTKPARPRARYVGPRVRE